MCSLVWRSQKRSSPDSAATIQSPSSLTMAAVTMAPYKHEIHFVTQSFDPAPFRVQHITRQMNFKGYASSHSSILTLHIFLYLYTPSLLFLFPTCFILHLSFSLFIFFLSPSYIQTLLIFLLYFLLIRDIYFLSYKFHTMLVHVDHNSFFSTLTLYIKGTMS